MSDLGEGTPELILMATGSEVSLILQAGAKLSEEGVNVRLVSFPSWELFEEQAEEYREAVLPGTIKARLAVEAGVSQGWKRWVGDSGMAISIEKFGASAPYQLIYEHYGLTVENIVSHARALLSKS
jgi:transketolase